MMAFMTISKSKNGFIVGGVDPNKGYESLDTTMVFESLDSLCDHVRDRFTPAPVTPPIQNVPPWYELYVKADGNYAIKKVKT